MSINRRLALFGLLALTGGLLSAADVTGSWKGSVQAPDQTLSITVNLKADGNAVTGSIEGLPSGRPTAIQDGKFSDGQVTFTALTDYQGQTFKLIWSGKLSGDQMNFSLATEGGEFSTQFLANRAGGGSASPSGNVSGTWKGAFDFQGQSVPLTVSMKQDGSAVTGQVEGLPAGAAQIKDGKSGDGKVTFWLMTEYQGMALKLVYNGAVGDAEIKFQFGTEDGSWGTEFVAKKV